ncbi:hypothetical protein CY34DRAFT_120536 [Suillus luteus UH-Slu-Lm8-n1]|uniref:Uncharacterized protein n=1 Tax=Suillus luteus UH-Slu-Lm8-n1 TaxID=930992 RepID=A0A0D0AHM6_9AGAM|nr:hypothetical protein CY34DRAFT_120536 [Suillus luteus UH-Slu-Lm8-n1]
MKRHRNTCLCSSARVTTTVDFYHKNLPVSDPLFLSMEQPWQMEYRDLALSSDNLFSNRGLFEIWQRNIIMPLAPTYTTNLLSIRCFMASVMNYPRG